MLRLGQHVESFESGVQCPVHSQFDRRSPPWAKMVTDELLRAKVEFRLVNSLR